MNFNKKITLGKTGLKAVRAGTHSYEKDRGLCPW